MSEGSRALADLDPFVVQLGAEATDGRVARFESTLYPRGGDADLSHRRWSLDSDVEHLHVTQDERWEVLSGRLRVVVDGEEHTLTEGEEVEIPENTPHRHWNPDDSPARVVWERRPALRTEAWAESVYALAQRGEMEVDGLPGMLQSAVILDSYAEESPYVTAVPVVAQRLGATVIAPIARLAGYEATHTRTDP